MFNAGVRAVARVAVIAVAFPAVMFLLVELLGGDLTDITVIVYLGVAAIYGAVVNRWWVCALPIVWSIAIIGALRLIDLANGGCSICTGDDDWGSYPTFILVVIVMPLTTALFVGVGLRRTRFFNRRIGVDAGAG